MQIAWVRLRQLDILGLEQKIISKLQFRTLTRVLTLLAETASPETQVEFLP